VERRRVKKYSAPGGFFLKATILPPFRYASFYLLCVCSASLFAEFQADDEFFSLSRERGLFLQEFSKRACDIKKRRVHAVAR
jgi:hypothetical protein